MSISAKYSSYRLSNLKIAFLVLIALTAWCVYDGYYNESFIAKHTQTTGQGDARVETPDHTLIFCQKFPYIGIPLAIVVVGIFLTLKNKHIKADDDRLHLSCGKSIKYSSIEELDHTDYDTKGKFNFLYESEGGKRKVTLSSKAWDGLDEVLGHLISKMS